MDGGCELGSLGAHHQLGVTYFTGKGVKQAPLAAGCNDERLNRNNLNIVENIINKNCRLAVRHMIYLSNWEMKSVVQGNVHESHLAKTQYADALRGWISMISRHHQNDEEPPAQSNFTACWRCGKLKCAFVKVKQHAKHIAIFPIQSLQ